VTRETPSISEIRALLDSARSRELASLISRFESDSRSGVVSACESARKRHAAEKAEVGRLQALYRMEGELRTAGCAAVVGLDEVGRGALAGPISVGAVVLPESPHIPLLDDSKKLRPEVRAQVAMRIRDVAIAYTVVHVSADEVDSMGVTAALRKAFVSALETLPMTPDRVLLDGLPMGVSDVETAVVKGDSLVAAIAAASVLAKVTRDELMVSLAETHPEYGFHINKGYGTAEHMAAIAEYGLCPLHRRSFVHGGGTQTLF
jgi:ribonuclease HII